VRLDSNPRGNQSRPKDDASTLTPTEARVAALVAKGRTNKEVAGELSLSVKTVEANLSRVYDKLNVRSRRNWSSESHQSGRTLIRLPTYCVLPAGNRLDVPAG
jgi:DNA-binding CsgD family transcriptional regulator